jgi:hypothetical protein
MPPRPDDVPRTPGRTTGLVPGLWNRARTQPRLARVSLGKQQLYDGGSYGLRPMNGYKLIYGGYARHCRDLDEAARHLLDAREKGREARFRVCESLTRDRQPTVEELTALVDVATRLVAP